MQFRCENNSALELLVQRCQSTLFCAIPRRGNKYYTPAVGNCWTRNPKNNLDTPIFPPKKWTKKSWTNPLQIQFLLPFFLGGKIAYFCTFLSAFPVCLCKIVNFYFVPPGAQKWCSASNNNFKIEKWKNRNWKIENSKNRSSNFQKMKTWTNKTATWEVHVRTEKPADPRDRPRLLSTQVMTFHSLGRSSSQARTAPRFCRVRDAGSRIQYAPELFGIASAWKRRLLELNEQFPTTKMAVWNSNSRSTHGSRWDSRWEVLILFSWNSHEAYPRFIRTGEDNIKFTPFPTPPPPPKILENAIPMRKQFRAGIARFLRSEHVFFCNST